MRSLRALLNSGVSRVIDYKIGRNVAFALKPLHKLNLVLDWTEFKTGLLDDVVMYGTRPRIMPCGIPRCIFASEV